MTTSAIVWFRRDLRLTDHPALHAAAASYASVLPLFIHAPDEDGDWAAGAAGRWWLHQSLASLQAALRRQHVDLHIGRGESLSVLREIIRRTGATAVYWNRLYEPASIARDSYIKKALRADGIEVHSFNAALWWEPWEIATRQEQPYRVFTPFWRQARTLLHPEKPLEAPASLHTVRLEGSLGLQQLELLPRVAWDSGLREAWTPGEAGAQAMLELFSDDALNGYAEGRDLPARHGTSRLSPHLHFGEISPRQIYASLHAQAQRRDTRRRPDLEPFLRELGWREFAHHLLYHFPRTPKVNFNPAFDRFTWARRSPTQLRRWQQGRTGIPLVDAGMRELWHTGWMHNRVRMIVASFLTKNLRQHWHHGARWFWDTLVDADLANNTLGWQWVAGCGADAAPYFRVFNPVSQARKFDPEGRYLRRWLPELAAVSDEALFEPWKEPGLLKRTGYPAPMVDLGASREAALGAYRAMR